MGHEEKKPNPRVTAVFAGKPDARAATDMVVSVEMDFDVGVLGTTRTELFHSVDDEDRGGAVIRLTIADDEGALRPFAKNTEDGVELHLPGQAEAELFLLSLREVVRMRQARGRFDLGIRIERARPEDGGDE